MEQSPQIYMGHFSLLFKGSAPILKKEIESKSFPAEFSKAYDDSKILHPATKSYNPSKTIFTPDDFIQSITFDVDRSYFLIDTKRDAYKIIYQSSPSSTMPPIQNSDNKHSKKTHTIMYQTSRYKKINIE